MLVVGAGEMGEGMAVALAGAGVAEVIVANRTLAAARRWPDASVAGPCASADVDRLLAEVDVVLAGADGGTMLDTVPGRSGPIGERADRPLLRHRHRRAPQHRPVGRPSSAGVTVLDLDDLRAWAATGVARRATEVRAAEDIVDEELARFADVAQARQVAPLIGQLRERAEDAAPRRADPGPPRGWASLTPEQADAVEALTRQLVAKLLHEPSVRLKTDAGTAAASATPPPLRDLFDLG